MKFAPSSRHAGRKESFGLLAGKVTRLRTRSSALSASCANDEGLKSKGERGKEGEKREGGREKEEERERDRESLVGSKYYSRRCIEVHSQA